ncbi:MAG: putative Ig domain-containing protein, partial [Sphingomonas sp.]|uniref:putative Ig domain-containing protein n=1 Tax=Sphingomonas sp. TaxID=28214 RepID=UPI00227413D5
MTRSYPGFTARSVLTFLAALFALITLLAPASVQAQVTIAPVVLPAGDVGSAYGTALTASGGTAPYSYAVTAGALPPGLALSAGGTISGTPTADGTFNFTVTATDSAPGLPETGSRAYSLTINPLAAPIANNVSATVAANSSANPITLNVTGGPPASVAVTTAPSHGTAIAAGTSITYTPTPGYSGTDSFQYNATNATGTSAQATVSITVAPPTIALSAIPATVQAGTPYSTSITATLGTAPYSFSLLSGSLPVGVAFSSGGVLSGTPVATGTFNFTVRATDSLGATGTRAYTITVTAPTIVLSPPAGALPGATASVPYSQTFTAPDPRYAPMLESSSSSCSSCSGNPAAEPCSASSSASSDG